MMGLCSLGAEWLQAWGSNGRTQHSALIPALSQQAGPAELGLN